MGAFRLGDLGGHRRPAKGSDAASSACPKTLRSRPPSARSPPGPTQSLPILSSGTRFRRCGSRSPARRASVQAIPEAVLASALGAAGEEDAVGKLAAQNVVDEGGGQMADAGKADGGDIIARQGVPIDAVGAAEEDDPRPGDQTGARRVQALAQVGHGEVREVDAGDQGGGAPKRHGGRASPGAKAAAHAARRIDHGLARERQAVAPW